MRHGAGEPGTGARVDGGGAIRVIGGRRATRRATHHRTLVEDLVTAFAVAPLASVGGNASTERTAPGRTAARTAATHVHERRVRAGPSPLER